MKFDKIIMNPPYLGTTHLSIVDKAQNHLVEDFGECVNLSPILWLQSKYKCNVVPKGIQSIDRIPKEDAQKLFARNPTDLGIYYITSENSNKEFNRFKMMGFSEFNKITKIYDKICKYKTLTFKDMITSRNKQLEKFSIIYSHMSGLNKNHNFVYTGNIGENGKTYKENVKNQHKNETSTHFEFDTFNEADNFRNSLFTDFFKFIELITQPSLLRFLDELPYMGDYTQPWTNKRFYKYFNLTEEEQKIIEDTMKEYE